MKNLTAFPRYHSNKIYHYIQMGPNKSGLIVEVNPETVNESSSYFETEIDIDFGVVNSEIMEKYFNKYLTSEEFNESLNKMKNDLPEYFVWALQII